MDSDSQEIEALFRSKAFEIIIVQEIEKVPDIWKTSYQSRISHNQNWTKVRLAVFERTSLLIPIATIQKIWNTKKNLLKMRLKRALVAHNGSPEELEEKMCGFGDDYAVMRFYRSATCEYEERLRKKLTQTVTARSQQNLSIDSKQEKVKEQSMLGFNTGFYCNTQQEKNSALDILIERQAVNTIEIVK